jgi:hypothetical protein
LNSEKGQADTALKSIRDMKDKDKKFNAIFQLIPYPYPGQSHQIFHEINNINELQGKREVLL